MSGPIIAMLTVVVVFGYVFAFMLLLKLFYWLADEIRVGSVGVKLVLLIPFLVIACVAIILDVIHTLVFCWAGYTMMVGARNWWHKR
jgi:hypothetical protein